jgi:hypothetical protein
MFFSVILPSCREHPVLKNTVSFLEFFFLLCGAVIIFADPKYSYADPNPTSHNDADPDPRPIKVMRICDHWSIDPPRSILSSHCDRLRPSIAPF